MSIRKEKDILGQRNVPEEALWGVHTLRAVENFPITGRGTHPELIHAYGVIKQACIETIIRLGYFGEDQKSADAVIRACSEMSEGLLDEHIKTDALQGGAGTSLNMNVNEVIANRALVILGRRCGDYEHISPADDINRFQSTNDTYPTALKLAAIRLLDVLQQRVVNLQEAFQAKEKEFADVVKIGRTQYQDAVLTTLGREMSAYAEALSRDRWRIYKCQERLRVVNLGGTAIGTGLAAPRRYIFEVVDRLRELTNIGFARAGNLVEATQNADVFVEVSGIVKALASSLIKICNDLRLMSSGPEGGLGEIRLPKVQAGSSIMPGKVNPVIPESVIQTAMLVCGYDSAITSACSAGTLELNPFLPLVSECLLNSIAYLANACEVFRSKCVEGIKADENRCRQFVENSTAVVTALVAGIGYEKACEIAHLAEERSQTVRQTAVAEGLVSEAEFDALITPEAVCRLGFTEGR